MGWQTIAGTTQANAGASGIKEFSASAPLAASELNRDFQDVQNPVAYGLASGVLVGGICTASGLTVTVPDGTIYYARACWLANGAQVYNVPDDATTYLWGCADGVVRQASAPSPPYGWDFRTACLLCKVTAASGNAVVDNSVQWKARRTDGAHMVQETAGVYPVADYVPDGSALMVPDRGQIHIIDSMTVYGGLSVYGKARVA
jgi:hypothetical protein